MAQPLARPSPPADRRRAPDRPKAGSDGFAGLPRAPMAFPVQDLTTAGPRNRPSLLWRLWDVIAQRVRL